MRECTSPDAAGQESAILHPSGIEAFSYALPSSLQSIFRLSQGLQKTELVVDAVEIVVELNFSLQSAVSLPRLRPYENIALFTATFDCQIIIHVALPNSLLPSPSATVSRNN